MNREEFLKVVGDEGLVDIATTYLDEVVHAAKDDEAAKINNDGLDAQLDYLGIGLDYSALLRIVRGGARQ